MILLLLLDTVKDGVGNTSYVVERGMEEEILSFIRSVFYAFIC